MGNLTVQSPLFPKFLLVSIKLQLQLLHLSFSLSKKEPNAKDFIFSHFMITLFWRKKMFKKKRIKNCKPKKFFDQKFFFFQLFFRKKTVLDRILTRFLAYRRTALKEECLYLDGADNIFFFTLVRILSEFLRLS